MPTANDIRLRIAEETAAEKVTASATNTPKVFGVGSIISQPGTERVILDASSFQLMECDGRVKGVDKRRYCFVDKGIKAVHNSQFVNSVGDRVYVITRELYMLLHGIFNNTLKQLRELDSRAKFAEEQSALYKLTIDVLRKKGIID